LCFNFKYPEKIFQEILLNKQMSQKLIYHKVQIISEKTVEQIDLSIHHEDNTNENLVKILKQND